MNERVIQQELLATATHLLTSTLQGVMGCRQNENCVIDGADKVLIACMPKSGSTWFTTLLERGLGLVSLRCYLQPDRNEQEIDALALFQSLGKEVLFVQQHVRASETTLQLCNAFSVKVIFLTRHIDDAVVSFRDHLENESTIAPMFYMEHEWFRDLTKTRQIDFLIDHCVPWYLNFSVSWIRAWQSNPEAILPVQYERLISEPSVVFFEISQFLGRKLRIEPELFETRSDVRFNQGRVGRGKEELNELQQQRIRALATYYDQVDLSSIGLPAL